MIFSSFNLMFFFNLNFTQNLNFSVLILIYHLLSQTVPPPVVSFVGTGIFMDPFTQARKLGSSLIRWIISAMSAAITPPLILSVTKFCHSNF